MAHVLQVASVFANREKLNVGSYSEYETFLNFPVSFYSEQCCG
jgi:hypothetical protein